MRIARRQKLEVLEIAGERKTDHGLIGHGVRAALKTLSGRLGGKFLTKRGAQVLRKLGARPAVLHDAGLVTARRKKHQDVGEEFLGLLVDGGRILVAGVVAADPGVLHAGDSELLERKEHAVLVAKVDGGVRREFSVTGLLGHVCLRSQRVF